MLNPGKKWVVRDRYGHEIYITKERWSHILEYHPELEGYLDDVLNTLSAYPNNPLFALKMRGVGSYSDRLLKRVSESKS